MTQVSHELVGPSVPKDMLLGPDVSFTDTSTGYQHEARWHVIQNAGDRLKRL